jgi:hypothetical protein
MTPEEKPKTVRVRFPVAINSKGEWAAFGLWHYNDAQMKGSVFVDDMSEGEIFHYIEADVPLPVAETIEGKVV